ncbi:AraC family transcriptional regulator [Rhodococcus opacus]|uniref:Putative AraC family transcriptional regulator n=1 Tax=Rhodococcus opacus (strain B4) TaxID=632772 RepID=C1AVA5_RHOOB|nr:AraC family transcriptional regulator [Rhodococcus opacus]BAH53595.1 putative AraC family transcriptional regulator [Rhodococcus opacus B4]
MVEVPASAFTDETARSRRGIFCATDDFDVYRASINDAYYPARLEILGSAQHLSDARMLAVRLTHMTVGVVHFGADVLIDPGDVCGYHIDLPLSGSLDTSCGPQSVVATPQRAAVYTPGEHTFLSKWAADNTQVSIKIDRAALEQELGRILGRPVNKRVRFDIGFDLTTPAGRRWASTLQILLDTIADPGPIPDPALIAQVGHLERALISGLLANQGHSMSEAILSSGEDSDNPAAVRKVLDLLQAAPGAQHTVPDLAEAAGIGVRQLQKLFLDRFEMSPSEYVRNMRLDGVRADLLERDPDCTVSEVAFRWGFNHLGRFAQYYEQKFGETPSRTLGNRQS